MADSLWSCKECPAIAQNVAKFRLDKLLVTSKRATDWWAQRIAEASDCVPGFGKLLLEH